MTRATRGARPVGRMEGTAGTRSYTAAGPRVSFAAEDSGPDEDWRHEAACRPELREAEGLDENLWFPIGDTGPALAWIEDAKAVCLRCPVASECLDWALETGQQFGVWGGASEAERKSMKRRTARARSRVSE